KVATGPMAPRRNGSEVLAGQRPQPHMALHLIRATAGQRLAVARIPRHGTTATGKASPATRGTIGTRPAGLAPPGHPAPRAAVGSRQPSPYGTGSGHAGDLGGDKDLPVKLQRRPAGLP